MTKIISIHWLLQLISSHSDKTTLPDVRECAPYVFLCTFLSRVVSQQPWLSSVLMLLLVLFHHSKWLTLKYRHTFVTSWTLCRLRRGNLFLSLSHFPLEKEENMWRNDVVDGSQNKHSYMNKRGFSVSQKDRVPGIWWDWLKFDSDKWSHETVGSTRLSTCLSIWIHITWPLFCTKRPFRFSQLQWRSGTLLECLCWCKRVARRVPHHSGQWHMCQRPDSDSSLSIHQSNDILYFKASELSWNISPSFPLNLMRQTHGQTKEWPQNVLSANISFVLSHLINMNILSNRFTVGEGEPRTKPVVPSVGL